MRTPARAALSRLVGWAADRRIPGPLRAPIYTSYARMTGADLSEVAAPLRDHRSMTEFFVRTLKDGARPIDADPSAIASPADGRIQAVGRVERGSLLQAKGRPYSLAELLGSEADARACDGGCAWTIYLSPRDYHRVHAPEAGILREVRRLGSARYSVAPKVVARRLVFPVNERAVLKLETARGMLWLVMVGALNVGRIRVVETGSRVARGGEIARFEMGSTVVLVAPTGAATPRPGMAEGDAIRLGRPIGAWA